MHPKTANLTHMYTEGTQHWQLSYPGQEGDNSDKGTTQEARCSFQTEGNCGVYQ